MLLSGAVSWVKTDFKKVNDASSTDLVSRSTDYVPCRTEMVSSSTNLVSHDTISVSPNTEYVIRANESVYSST